MTVAGSPAGGQVWYTDDGSAAVTGDALAETAKLYTAPVPVTAPVHLSFAYFNTDGNVAQSSGFYKPGASQPAPAVPQNVVSSALAAKVPRVRKNPCHTTRSFALGDSAKCERIYRPLFGTQQECRSNRQGTRQGVDGA